MHHRGRARTIFVHDFEFRIRAGPDQRGIAGAEAGRSETAEVAEKVAACEDRGGRGVAVELVDPLRVLAGEKEDVVKEFAGRCFHAEGTQFHTRKEGERLIPCVRAQPFPGFLFRGWGFDGCGHPDSAIGDDWGRPAPAGEFRAPCDPICFAPCGGQVLAGGVSLAIRSAPLGPVGLQGQAGEEQRKERAFHDPPERGKSPGSVAGSAEVCAGARERFVMTPGRLPLYTLLARCHDAEILPFRQCPNTHRSERFSLLVPVPL